MSIFIKKKFIGDDEVDGAKVLVLNNQAVRAKNAAGSAVELFKLDSSDVLQFVQMPQVSSDPSSANHLARKSYIDAQDAAEAAARAAAVSSLESAVDAEEARALAAEAALQSEIDAEEAARAAAVSAEASARAAADTALQSAIDAEESAREAADTALQGEIDAEEAARAAAVSAEAVARAAADDALSLAISAESTNRAAEIAAEAAAREAADAVLSADISDEATARAAADEALDGKIDQEIFDRSEAISTLIGGASSSYDSLKKIEDKIEFMVQNTEPTALDSLAEIVSAFQSADGDINTAITNLAESASSGLAAETAAREAADAAETAAREAADAAEAAARAAADTAETAAREAADTAEAAAREAADLAEAAAREAEDATFLKLDGSRTMTGNLAMSSGTSLVIGQASGGNGTLQSILNVDFQSEVLPETVFLVGNAEVNTNSGSSALDVAGGYAETSPATGDLDANDFEIQLDVYPTTAISGYSGILSNGPAVGAGDSLGWALITETDGTLAFYASIDGIGGWSIPMTTATPLTPNQWNTVKVTRVGSLFKLFHDGVEVASVTVAGSIANPADSAEFSKLMIGNYGNFPLLDANGEGYNGSSPFPGYIKNVEIKTGQAASSVEVQLNAAGLAFAASGGVISNVLAATETHHAVNFGQLDSAVLSVSNALLDEILNRNEAISNEAAARAAADTAEAAARAAADTAEAAAREAADAALQSEIDAEELAREAADVAEAAAREAADAAEAAARAAADAAEEAARIAGDDALDARLDVIEGDDTTVGSIAKALKDSKDYTDAEVAAEESRALAAEAAVQAAAEAYTDAEISAVKGSVSASYDSLKKIEDKIEFIVQNTDPAALDSLAEIVTAFQGADGSINAAISALAASASADLDAEEAARIAADSAEASARQSADDALDARLDVLEADPTTKTYVDAQVASEAAARIAGDAVLQAAIDAVESSLAAFQPAAPEVFTLSATDVSNQYVELAVSAVVANSLEVRVNRMFALPSEFTQSSGTAGKVRLTFAGALASGGQQALVAGDTLVVRYWVE